MAEPSSKITLQDIIDGKASLTSKQKEAAKKALGLESKGSDDYLSSDDAIEERMRYNQVLQETATLLGNNAEASAREYDVMLDKLKQMGMSREQINELERGQIANLTETLGMEFQLEEVEIRRLQHLASISRGQRKYGKEQKKLLGDLANGIGLTMRLQDTFLGKVISVGNALRQSGEEGRDAQKAFKENFKEIFNWTNASLTFLAAVTEKSIELIVALDKSRAKLAAVTGAGYEFSDAMFDAQRSANLFGVSMEEAGEATASLLAQTSQFAKLSTDQQASLVQTSAMLKKLEVSYENSAAVIDFFNNNLGMTQAQAEETTKSLAMMGNEIGISTSKILKDYQTALPTLAVYGKQSVDVFTGLAAAAKAANVETGTLLGITKKFDTFAGAAEGAGKLNALLGTNLSTTQMLMMTEEERMLTLIDAVQSQGVAFKDMDKYTQLAIAHAAGIEDMNEANKIFGMSGAEYEKNKEIMLANAEATGKFEKAVADAVPVFTKFMLLATELVVSVEPILEVLGEVAESLTLWLQGLDTDTKTTIVTIASLAAGLGLLFLTIGPAIATMGTFAATLASTGPAGAAAAGGITAMGTALTGVLGALGTLLATPVVGELIMLAMGFGAALAAMAAGTMIAMSAAYAIAADAGAREAEAQAAMAESMKGLTTSADGLISSLEKIGSSDFSAAIQGMGVLLEQANKLGTLNPTATATIENLALLTVGRAKDSMTNKTIEANTTNIKAQVTNVFEGMKMVVEIKDVGPLEGYVKKVSQEQILK